MDIIQTMQTRYAAQTFDPSKKVSEADLATILEALRLTPSGFGLQPWKFVVVENQDIKNQLIPHSYGQAKITDASHLLVLCARTDVDEHLAQRHIDAVAKTRGIDVGLLDGYKSMITGFIANGIEHNFIDARAKNQVYIALGVLMVACASLGIDSCPMEGFDPTKYDETLGLSKLGLRSVVICPIGYRAAGDHHAEDKKVRFAIEELVVRM